MTSTGDRIMDEAVYRAMLDAHTAMRGDDPDVEQKRYLWMLAQRVRGRLGLSVEVSSPELTQGTQVKGAVYISRMVTPWQLEQVLTKK